MREWNLQVLLVLILLPGKDSVMTIASAVNFAFFKVNTVAQGSGFTALRDVGSAFIRYLFCAKYWGQLFLVTRVGYCTLLLYVLTDY